MLRAWQRGPASPRAVRTPYPPPTASLQPLPLRIMSSVADVTDSQWDTVVLQSDLPVLVDFWAEWCGPCRAMAPLVDKLADELKGKVRVVKLNTSDNTEVPAKYGITAIPTFLLIKQGKQVKSMVGSQSYAAFKANVEGAL